MYGKHEDSIWFVGNSSGKALNLGSSWMLNFPQIHCLLQSFPANQLSECPGYLAKLHHVYIQTHLNIATD
jgi:hypothetical protein